MSYRRNQRRKGKLQPAYHIPRICPECKHIGSHFVPPNLGEEGFYACILACKTCILIDQLNRLEKDKKQNGKHD